MSCPIVEDLLKCRLVRKVVKFKNGRVWVLAHGSAYDGCGRSCKELLDALRAVPSGKLCGHDDNERLFNLRSSKGEVFVK